MLACVIVVSKPGILSGSGALWLGIRRKASKQNVGVKLPMIIFFSRRGGYLVLRCARGRTLVGLIFASRDKTFISSCYIMN